MRRFPDDRTENQHLSSLELRQRAAAILKSTRDEDGIDEVTEILNIIRSRYQQGKRRGGNIQPLSDAREPRR